MAGICRFYIGYNKGYLLLMLWFKVCLLESEVLPFNVSLNRVLYFIVCYMYENFVNNTEMVEVACSIYVQFLTSTF